jgi:hypothetical protein
MKKISLVLALSTSLIATAALAESVINTEPVCPNV